MIKSLDCSDIILVCKIKGAGWKMTDGSSHICRTLTMEVYDGEKLERNDKQNKRLCVDSVDHSNTNLK